MLKRIFAMCLSAMVLFSAFPTGLIPVGSASGTIAAAPAAPADVAGATYYMNKTFDANIPAHNSKETHASGAQFTWFSKADNHSFSTQYNAMGMTALTQAKYDTAISADGDYVVSMDFMAPTVDPSGSGANIAITVGSYAAFTIWKDNAFYLHGKKTSEEIEAGNWYRFTAEITLPSGDVTVTVKNMTTGADVATGTATGKCTAIDLIKFNFSAVTASPLYTQNWRFYTTTPQSGGDDSGDDADDPVQPTPSPSAPADVAGATYYMNKTFDANIPAHNSKETHAAGAQFTWFSKPENHSFSTQYNAMGMTALTQAKYGTAISADGDYVVSMDFMAPTVDEAGSGANIAITVGSYAAFAIWKDNAFYLHGKKTSEEIAAGNWYRFTAEITLPSGDVTVTVKNMTTGADVATGTATEKCTAIDLIKFNFSAVTASPLYTQNWRFYTTTPQSGGDDGGDNGGEDSGDDNDEPVQPTPSPAAPADVDGAAYYLSETFTAKPSGTKIPLSGVSYTWGVSGANSFSSEYNALAMTAYTEASYNPEISLAGDYVLSLDFMAPTVDFTGTDNTTKGIRLFLGSYFLSTIGSDGALNICTQSTGHKLQAGNWYRLTAEITLPSGDITATVKNLTTNTDVATKSATAAVTSIPKLRFDMPAVLKNPLYTQNWRIYTTTEQPGIEPPGPNTDLARGKIIDFFCPMNVDMYPDRTGMEFATDANDETYFDTGNISYHDTTSGPQIAPFINLGGGVRYNKIRIRHEAVRSQNAPAAVLLKVTNTPRASSSFQTIGDYSNSAEVDTILRFPVKTESYIGYHFNGGLDSVGKWETSLKIYSLEVYYDGHQLEAFSLPAKAVAPEDGEIRVSVNALNADGDTMTDFSDYTWSVEKITGCDGVEFDEETGEIIVRSDATSGEIKITITNNEDATLSFTDTMVVFANDVKNEDVFTQIAGNDKIIIPATGSNKLIYQVNDINGDKSQFSNMLVWSLDKEYPGISLNGTEISVSNEAEEGEIVLIANADGYILQKTITLSKASDNISAFPAEVTGPLFVASPYYGEEEIQTAQYKAFDFNGNEMTNVVWTLKGAPAGVSISQSGVLTVPGGIVATELKVIASIGEVSAEKRINIVERYEGAPNLLRLEGTTVSITAADNKEMAYDGDFNTASNNEQFSGTRAIDVTLPKKYDIDVFRVYKDFGGVYAAGQVTCRIGTDPFGGKGWCNAPLESETWNPAPAYYSDNLKYTMTTTYHGVDVYEAELYSSYMRFNSIYMPSGSMDIPSAGANTMQLKALSENGDELSTVTYADGEVHPLKWRILYPAAGITIDEETGVITVSDDAQPTVITVEATYFGRAITAPVKIGSGNAAQMDYDWLTFDKLSKQSADDINYKMTLPYEGICGSSIKWTSSNRTYITEYGDVYLPYKDGDKNITLTATISGGGVTLTKSFDVVVKEPAAFEDLNILSDREFFGLWDAANNAWAVNGKLDYDANNQLRAIGEAVKAMDYTKAKELLYKVTLDKLRDPVFTENVASRQDEAVTQAYANYTTSYGFSMLDPIAIGNERKWYSHDVKTILSTHLKFNIVLQSEMKEYAEVEIDSKESEFAPYIIVKFSNGTEKRFDVVRDTTLRAGYFRNVNYGSESVMKVKDDTGYPIDANTKRAYMYFDLSGVEVEDVSSAQLFLHGQNVSKTGNKNLYVVYNVSEWNETEETWTSAKISDSLYSYSGPNNAGFSYSFSPGGDAEVTYQQNGGRLGYLGYNAIGFPATGNEKYSYNAFRLMDNYFRKAGEFTSYPRTLDSYTRNNWMLIAYKQLVNSIYLTPETSTVLWKHIWRQQEEMLIGRDPFWHGNSGNIAISLSQHLLKMSIEFPEFNDVSKWIDFYVEVMEPIMETSILPDGSYVEAADGYGTTSIVSFANSVTNAKDAGIELGAVYDERIHASAYNYAAMKAPGYSGIKFGDSWKSGGNSTKDAFLTKMAKMFDDDELLYISAYGAQGGTEPDNATLYFPNTKRAFMRSEWSKEASYLAINADDGYGGHAHEDDLSIIAYAYGDFVIPDTSVLSYATDDISKSMRKSYQHNTLGRITDMKTGEVSTQAYSSEINKTKVVSWETDSAFDYYSANVKPKLYTDRNTNYNRKVLFVKPGYWIVSDYVKDNEPQGRTDNKYEIMFHLRPDSNPLIEGTSVSTDSDSTNVHLVTPDNDVSLSLEDAYYTENVGSYLITDRAVYSKTAAADRTVTFDTVVYPAKNGDNAEISAQRLETGVESEVASAMHISRSDSLGEFDDYYYYTNEKNFDSDAVFTERRFGDFSFDGELAYQSYSKKGELKSALMISGTRLLKNGEAVISIDTAADMFDITIDNFVMYINCSEEDVASLGNVVIDTNGTINEVYYNNAPVEYSRGSDGTIVLGSNKVMLNTEVITENGASYIKLDRLNFSGKFSYNSKSYAVSINIPEGTKIRPIEGWNGIAVLRIATDETGVNAGTVTIMTEDNRAISFLTPYTIYVEQHASASVNGGSGNTTIDTNRDKLWITTTSSRVTVGKIKEVSLPGGFSPSEGTSGGENSGGGTTGGGGGAGGGGSENDKTEDNQTGGDLAATSIFNDVADVEWAHEAIASLYQQKIINGVGDKLFAPNNLVTRAEFVTMIVRAFNLTANEKNAQFVDVADGMWYTDAIETAASIGIVKGVSDNVFDVNAQITRQDMMVILHRTIEHSGVKGEKGNNVVISDYDEISAYATEAVEYMVGNGIVNGVGENRVAPKNFATRAQSAKIIYGVLNLYDKH